MSLNIKTSSGLQKLTPEVNNATITAAIGYTPADKGEQDAHIADSNIHTSPAEKARIENHLNNQEVHVTLEEKERWG
jgi:hypothetical protein